MQNNCKLNDCLGYRQSIKIGFIFFSQQLLVDGFRIPREILGQQTELGPGGKQPSWRCQYAVL